MVPTPVSESDETGPIFKFKLTNLKNCTPNIYLFGIDYNNVANIETAISELCPCCAGEDNQHFLN